MITNIVSWCKRQRCGGPPTTNRPPFNMSTVPDELLHTLWELLPELKDRESLYRVSRAVRASRLVNASIRDWVYAPITSSASTAASRDPYDAYAPHVREEAAEKLRRRAYQRALRRLAATWPAHATGGVRRILIQAACPDDAAMALEVLARAADDPSTRRAAGLLRSVEHVRIEGSEGIATPAVFVRRGLNATDAGHLAAVFPNVVSASLGDVTHPDEHALRLLSRAWPALRELTVSLDPTHASSLTVSQCPWTTLSEFATLTHLDVRISLSTVWPPDRLNRISPPDPLDGLADLAVLANLRNLERLTLHGYASQWFTNLHVVSQHCPRIRVLETAAETTNWFHIRNDSPPCQWTALEEWRGPDAAIKVTAGSLAMLNLASSPVIGALPAVLVLVDRQFGDDPLEEDHYHACTCPALLCQDASQLHELRSRGVRMPDVRADFCAFCGGGDALGWTTKSLVALGDNLKEVTLSAGALAVANAAATPMLTALTSLNVVVNCMHDVAGAFTEAVCALPALRTLRMYMRAEGREEVEILHRIQQAVPEHVRVVVSCSHLVDTY